MESDSRSEALPILFHPLHSGNLEQLKRINSVIFPIKYQESFYRDCAAAGDVTQLAMYNNEVVGAIACRLELQQDNTAKLYIMTLGVLAPYRNMGIGSRLLERSLAICAEDPNITEAYLHVHTINHSAIDFYRKFGFSEGEILRNYYKRLNPPDAVTLSKYLQPIL